MIYSVSREKTRGFQSIWLVESTRNVNTSALAWVGFRRTRRRIDLPVHKLTLLVVKLVTPSMVNVSDGSSSVKGDMLPAAVLLTTWTQEELPNCPHPSTKSASRAGIALTILPADAPFLCDAFYVKSLSQQAKNGGFDSLQKQTFNLGPPRFLGTTSTCHQIGETTTQPLRKRDLFVYRMHISRCFVQVFDVNMYCFHDQGRCNAMYVEYDTGHDPRIECMSQVWLWLLGTFALCTNLNRVLCGQETQHHCRSFGVFLSFSFSRPSKTQAN